MLLTFTEDQNSDSVGCDRRFLKEILRDLERIASLVLSGPYITNPLPIDLLRLYLLHIDHEIERIMDHGLIKCERTRNVFTKLVEQRLNTIEAYFESYNSIGSAYDEYEQQCANKSLPLPPGTPKRPETLPWPAWGRNLAKRPNADQLNQANAKGINVPIRQQFLPRGSLTILEHWRKDVNDVVDSILQVKSSRAICWWISFDTLY